MARWQLIVDLDRSASLTIPRQLAQTLTADIVRGRLRPGQRLPGSRTLARALGVHRQTVVSAIDELIAEGWLVSRPAAGVFVADGLADPSAAPLKRRVNAHPRPPARFAVPVALPPAPELPRTIPPRAILMSGTRPDVRLVPADLIGRAYRRALKVNGSDLLSYTHPAGLQRLRDGLATMLSATRGLAVDADGLIVTRGSQMALALTARALVLPGDVVAVEHPGYRPAWEAFRLAGAEVVPVPVDEHGLDIRALRRLVSRREIRAVYVTPHHQFPTTVTLAAPRRMELLRLAAQRRFAIVEDDYDHEFHYSGRPVLPMASFDAEGVVIYIGTLSKVLAPGLRLGFVAAARDFVERLVAYRSFIDLQGDSVLECAVADLLDEGLLQRHVRKVVRIYRARLHALTTALRRQLGGFVTFRPPSGGTAIWVTTRDARTMSAWNAAAARLGVIFDAGGAFTLNGQPARGARLGFACLTEEEIATASRRLTAAAPHGAARRAKESPPKSPTRS